ASDLSPPSPGSEAHLPGPGPILPTSKMCLSAWKITAASRAYIFARGRREHRTSLCLSMVIPVSISPPISKEDDHGEEWQRRSSRQPPHAEPSPRSMAHAIQGAAISSDQAAALQARILRSAGGAPAGNRRYCRE